MDNYEKFKSIHHEVANPFTELFKGKDYNVKEARLNSRTIFNKVVGYAIRELRSTDIDAVLLIGQDSSVELVLKCATVLQRKFKGILHQCNAQRHKIVEDIWIPKDGNATLDMFSVKTHIPVLFILLAKSDLHLK